MVRNLSFGMRGEDVRAVQLALNTALEGVLPPLPGTDYFGNDTLTAVRRFQERNALNPDGIVGPKTRRKLFPLRTVTVQAIGMRLRMPEFPPRRNSIVNRPNLLPGQLQIPGRQATQPALQPNLLANTLRLPFPNPAVLSYQPQRFPQLRFPLAVPPIGPPPAPQLPPPHILPAPSPGFQLPIHHWELAPGAQATFGREADAAFTLALQAVVMIGNEDGAHQEFTSGLQLASPSTGGNDWSFGWFAQITDVDRLGAIGAFHYWQPYAQIGIQRSANSFAPVLGAALMPVNLTLDASRFLGINVAGGAVINYDIGTGQVTAGAQVTAGVVVKLGQ
jgi:hypothetical protein